MVLLFLLVACHDGDAKLRCVDDDGGGGGGDGVLSDDGFL